MSKKRGSLKHSSPTHEEPEPLEKRRPEPVPLTENELRARMEALRAEMAPILGKYRRLSDAPEGSAVRWLGGLAGERVDTSTRARLWISEVERHLDAYKQEKHT